MYYEVNFQSFPSRLHPKNDEYYSYPLTDYYISSSHNTYLLGRQVGGESSVEGYIRALRRGCRCVEIDVWDASNDSGEPVVNHGRTFSKSIKFSDVISAIKRYAFVTSPYPVILSLEINCSSSFQKKLVAILKEMLGDDLVSEVIDEAPVLPSPQELKYKYLVKVKKTSKYKELYETEDGSYTTSSSTTPTSFSEDSARSNGSLSITSLRRGTAPKVIEILSQLGVYVQGIKFRNFSLPESKVYNHCFSLSEKTINKMLKDEIKRTSLDKHNRKYFVRVYPSKFRLKSSNFNPINYWKIGVQMVATNWQTYDLGQQLNEAMFDGVGIYKSGYVLKPSSLRKPVIKTSKLYKMPPLHVEMMQLSITIVSAHNLPTHEGETINPFVTLEVIGADSVHWENPKMESGRTRSLSLSSCRTGDATWEETFVAEMIGSRDFTFVKFVVNSTSLEKADVQQLGLVVVKLDYMEPGYRTLHLHDHNGEQMPDTSLSVKINS
ncbi:uncharacterized protein LODBEIA_P60450 [Lodderomyces beijingensis]|uniref:Phosphoinositide phospholipase C n=1 Tax=Lodderomyces beijingensis TaxID=1775926 RepID=A0ABP0ZWA3_9ASCO